jgi:UDP-glucose 4-epimerase
VPLYSRDLNYSVYFAEGEEGPIDLESYTFDTTDRLGVEATKQLLLTIPELRQEIGI